MMMRTEVSEINVNDSFARSRSTNSWANDVRVLILRFIYGIPFLTIDSVI